MGDFELSDRFTDEFVAKLLSWINDARNRRRLNAPPQNISRDALLRYLKGGKTEHRHFVGIRLTKTGRWVGMFEVLINMRHRNASLITILDPDFSRAHAALAETTPALALILGSKGVEKAVAKVPETDERLLRHYQRSDWKQEAHFQLELESHYVPGQRIGVFQFGKQLQVSVA